MRTRAVVVVALAAVLLTSGVGLGMHAGEDANGADGVQVDADAADRAQVADGAHAASASDAVGDASAADDAHAAGDAPRNAAQYEVSLDNVTVRTWLLRNSTVRNATVEEVVIRNATTTDGAREDVTLRNVTVGEFEVERGRLLNVSATQLVVRNKSVLDVPGGEFIDPNVEGRTIDREWTRNSTVAGVVIDRMSIDAAVLCGNASLGEETDEPAAFDPRAADDDPAITVQNGSAEEALIIRGHASNWNVGSVDQPEASDASLPQGCQRGQGDGGGDDQGDGQETDQGGGQDGDQSDGQGSGDGDNQGNGDGDGQGDDAQNGDDGGQQDGGDGNP